MNSPAPRCLVCYKALTDFTSEYHPSCSTKLFGTRQTPILDLSLDQLHALASVEVRKRISVPGVLPKLSLELTKPRSEPPRLTIVKLWGTHIFKPPAARYPNLPENEDLCMRLAELCEITVATHGLIRLKSGELCYVCKRFDRIGETKLHQEDLCQLTRTLTENKYDSSTERVGKTIMRYSTNPGLECTKFFEQIVFSFLIGNSDMHLKNFSLLRSADGDYILSPAYDLVSTKLALPSDLDESALTVQGKKKGITKNNLLQLGDSICIPNNVASQLIRKILSKLGDFEELIRESFLPVPLQENLISVISDRAARLS